jgi:hypothetical protein
MFGMRILVKMYTRSKLRSECFHHDESIPYFKKILSWSSTDGQVRYFHTKHLVSNLDAQGFNIIRRIRFSTTNPEGVAQIREHAGQVEEARSEMERALNLVNMNRKFFPAAETADFLQYIMVFPTILTDAALSHFPLPFLTMDIPTPDGFGKRQIEQLMQRNWCPYTLNKLKVTTNYTVLYWLWASEFGSLSSIIHLNCEKNQCHA